MNNLTTYLLFTAPIWLLTGCGSSPAPISSPPVALSSKQWEGAWEATLTSHFGNDSKQALILNRGGRGFVVFSAVHRPQYSPAVWVSEIPFHWATTSPTQVKVSLGEATTLLGQGEWSRKDRRTGVFDLCSTEKGLIFKGLGLESVAFSKDRRGVAGDIAGQIVADTRQRSFAMGGNPDSISQGPTTGQQVAGVFLAGAGLGAASNKDYGMAQQLLNQASTTMAGKPSAQGAGGKDIIGNVTLGDSEISAYTDGKAYDIITMMPTTDGASAGEWCYQYGIPVGNARSLLATGYAMAGDRSAYGSGNPQQSISWRSYPVRKGQKIKMGMEWKRGQAVVTPFANRQATNPL